MFRIALLVPNPISTQAYPYFGEGAKQRTDLHRGHSKLDRLGGEGGKRRKEKRLEEPKMAGQQQGFCQGAAGLCIGGSLALWEEVFLI